MKMAFDAGIVQDGIAITIRVTKQELDILKYVGLSGYDQNIGHQFSVGRSYDNPEEYIRKLLYWEILTVLLQSGEVEKHRLNLVLAGQDPDVDLRITNPDLFIKSGGIVRDKRIPHYKPKFPALMHIR